MSEGSATIRLELDPLAELSSTHISVLDTMSLDEAAEYVKVHPNTLSELAREGKAPGAKPGKEWVFLRLDLIGFIRGNYRPQASSGSHQGDSNWESTDGKTRKSGGSVLALRASQSEYDKALEPKTSKKHRSITTA